MEELKKLLEKVRAEMAQIEINEKFNGGTYRVAQRRFNYLSEIASSINDVIYFMETEK